MSGFQSSQLQALRALLEAAPLNMRLATWDVDEGTGDLSLTESATGNGSRGYAYDVVRAGGGEWRPLSNHNFDAGVGVEVRVFVPVDGRESHRTVQEDAMSDYCESVRSRVLLELGGSRATGLHSVEMSGAVWVLTIPFMLTYEEDANG